MFYQWLQLCHTNARSIDESLVQDSNADVRSKDTALLLAQNTSSSEDTSTEESNLQSHNDVTDDTDDARSIDEILLQAQKEPTADMHRCKCNIFSQKL